MNVLSFSFATAIIAGSVSGVHAASPTYVAESGTVDRAHSGAGTNGVAANGRCGGISYGTAARSCGTATGGPVGGINSRN